MPGRFSECGLVLISPTITDDGASSSSLSLGTVKLIYKYTVCLCVCKINIQVHCVFVCV